MHFAVSIFVRNYLGRFRSSPTLARQEASGFRGQKVYIFGCRMVGEEENQRLQRVSYCTCIGAMSLEGIQTFRRCCRIEHGREAHGSAISGSKLSARSEYGDFDRRS